VDVARAAQALAPRDAPSFLKSKEYLRLDKKFFHKMI
jgi:hypothetical protein